MDGLAVGRIVHFTCYGGTHLAAIVVGVPEGDEGLANLQVFHDDKPFYNSELTSYYRAVPYSPLHAPLSWHWPERA